MKIKKTNQCFAIQYSVTTVLLSETVYRILVLDTMHLGDIPVGEHIIINYKTKFIKIVSCCHLVHVAITIVSDNGC